MCNKGSFTFTTVIGYVQLVDIGRNYRFCCSLVGIFTKGRIVGWVLFGKGGVDVDGSSVAFFF